MRKLLLLSGVVAIVIFGGCKKRNEFKKDLTGHEIELQLHRFDKDLFADAQGDLTGHVQQLLTDNALFLELFSYQIIRIGSPYSADYTANLRRFMTHSTVVKAKKQVDEVFADFDSQYASLNKAFSYYHYYFPEMSIPEVYTFIGGFNESIVMADRVLAIGLDKYLGRDCVYYDQLGFPEYLQAQMKPEVIPFDAVRGWLTSEFVFNDSIENVLSHMMYQGIIQYAMDALFPEEPAYLKFGFSEEEYNWCADNYRAMWEFLIEHELLFSTDHMSITKYIKPAPFTQGFPDEAPGRAIVSLGREIVGAYMQRHPEVSLPELLNTTDYSLLFREARYKP